MKNRSQHNSVIIKSVLKQVLTTLTVVVMFALPANSTVESDGSGDLLPSSVYGKATCDVESQDLLIAGKKKKPGTSGRKPLFNKQTPELVQDAQLIAAVPKRSEKKGTSGRKPKVLRLYKQTPEFVPQLMAPGKRKPGGTRPPNRPS